MTSTAWTNGHPRGARARDRAEACAALRRAALLPFREPGGGFRIAARARCPVATP